MGNPLLPQAVNKVHDRKLRHVAIFRPEWWKEGDFFFPRRERESNLSLWHDDVALGQFFTYLNGLSHLFIFMYLFVALFIFIREISFNLNWLRVSAVDSIDILAGSPSASSPSSSPAPSLPRHAACYVLRKPNIFWRCMSICKDVFWVVCYFILLLRYFIYWTKHQSVLRLFL